MTDEERQRQMDFILGQQAKFTVDMDELRASDERAARRLDRLERIVKLAVRAGLRERHGRREQDERITAVVDAQIHQDERMTALIDAQIHTETIAHQNTESISRLAEIVERIAIKNGNGTK
jgi:hypothetical protein